MFVYTYECMYLCLYVCLYVCMHVQIRVCVYVCMYICMLLLHISRDFLACHNDLESARKQTKNYIVAPSL